MWAHILNLLNIPICDTTVHMALGWSLVLHSCQLRSHINHLLQTQQTQLSDRQLSYLIRHDKLTPKAEDVFNSIFWNRISGEAGIASKFSSRKLKWTLARVSAQVNDAIALICESHHVHCQLVATRCLISNFSSQCALVWQETWLLLLVRVEVGDTNTIGPIGRRDDLWPAEVVNCVSLSSSSELKLNWRCWDLKRDTNCSSEAADSCRGELTI